MDTIKASGGVRHLFMSVFPEGVIDQKLHRGLIPRQNYLWVDLSRFLEAVTDGIFVSVILDGLVRFEQGLR
ncbi:hypothetical protein [Coleofasciculus sp. F4-SAH-05]|uniref:hypothetical protein n=1 Tax=Coleofasciculus sp. F4-SAH-05 TaxID=3069525 RepID=UPI0032F8F261